MTKEEAIKSINKLRRNSKDKWYYWSEFVDGSHFYIKGYNTWIQKLETTRDRITYSTNMECSVKEFNKFLNEVL